MHMLGTASSTHSKQSLLVNEISHQTYKPLRVISIRQVVNVKDGKEQNRMWYQNKESDPSWTPWRIK